MSLQRQTTEINGRTYTVGYLKLAQARECFVRLQRMLAAWDDDELKASSVSPFGM